MKNSALLTAIATLTTLVNVLFFLWILYNGINEHFAGTPLEVFSYIILMLLLLINSALLRNAYIKSKPAG